jgi:hypothetical protein
MGAVTLDAAVTWQSLATGWYTLSTRGGRADINRSIDREDEHCLHACDRERAGTHRTSETADPTDRSRVE